MRTLLCIFLLGLTLARGAQPPELVDALKGLRELRSYSWEIINGDPGPVAQRSETRRGTVTTVQQNLSPHVKGSLTTNGEMLIERDWPDGLRMDTFVSADGATVTRTPEGWMNAQEVLEAIAEERSIGSTSSERYRWLRRADRPDLRRPDQELAPFFKGLGAFEASGDSYTARFRTRLDGTVITDDDDSQAAINVTITLNIRRGTLRDYEIKIEGSQAVGRLGVQLPVNDDRLVIISYLPVMRLDVPDEARAKLKSLRSAGSQRD